jgi:hypothetical protein
MWEVRATGEELYAQFGGRGPVLVIAPDGTVTEQLRPIDIVEPMVPLDEAVDEVLWLIRDVPLTRAVRKAIAEKLTVDPEHVGRTPDRKVRAS